MEELFISYFTVIIAYVFCLLVGALFLTLIQIKLKSHFWVVSSLIAGYTLISVGHGIYLTTGSTILLGFPCLLLAYLILRKQLNSNSELSTIKIRSFINDSVSGLLILTLFFALYCVLYNIHTDLGQFVQLPHGDSLFYQKVSTYIHYTGQENMLGSINYFEESFEGNNIYHYFDLYFPQWLIKWSQLPPYKVRILCCSSLLLTIIGLLLLSVAKQNPYFSYSLKKPQGWLTLLIPFTVLCYGVDLGLIAESGNYKVSFLGYWEGKYIIPLLWIMMVYVLFCNKNRVEAIFLLYSLPFVFISYLPAVLFGSAVYGLYLLFLKNRQHRNIELPLIAILLFSVPAFIFIFYQVTGLEQQDEVLSLVNTESGFAEKILLSLRIILGTTVKYWVDYIPHLLLLAGLLLFNLRRFFNLRDKPSVLQRFPIDRIILFTGLWLGGLIGWAIIATMSPESNQLFRNIAASVIMSVFLIEMIYYFDKFPRNQQVFLASSLGILIAIQIYIPIQKEPWFYNGPTISKSFENQIRELQEKKPNSSAPLLIASLGEAKKDYQKGKPEVFYFGNFLMGFEDDLLVVNITPAKNLDHPLPTEQLTAFHQFYRKKRQNSQNKSIQQVQSEFLTANNIPYLICSQENSQNPLLANMKLIAKDSSSQAHLYQVGSE